MQSESCSPSLLPALYESCHGFTAITSQLVQGLPCCRGAVRGWRASEFVHSRASTVYLVKLPFASASVRGHPNGPPRRARLRAPAQTRGRRLTTGTPTTPRDEHGRRSLNAGTSTVPRDGRGAIRPQSRRGHPNGPPRRTWNETADVE